jgi:hypothetical protein
MSDKQWLTRVRGLLQRHCGHFIKGRIELINAKVVGKVVCCSAVLLKSVTWRTLLYKLAQVPILKFFDRAGSLEVDLSVNNPTSIRNTHLLFCYSQADYRVRPLVLAVKLWAKEHGINEARQADTSLFLLSDRPCCAGSRPSPATP